VKDIATYLLIEKRIGAVKTGKKAWLSLVDPYGYLHPTIIPCSAVTMRATHSDPNISQVPSVRNVKVKDEHGNVKTYVNKRGETEEVLRVGKGEEGKWGWDCRELFTVPDGFVMVGVDLSGIELRCWAHYQAPYDDGALIDIILNGDVHGQNQRILQLADRRKAKEWLFAMLYGGGDEQLGFILAPTASIPEQERQGRQSKQRFMQNVRGFDQMKSNLEASVRRRGWLRGIDGRRVPIRKPHAALNTQLQSCGAIISKYWIYNTIKALEDDHGLKWGYDYDYTLLLYSHDEIQFAVRDAAAPEAFRNSCLAWVETLGEADKKPWKGETFEKLNACVAAVAIKAAAKAGDQMQMRIAVAAEAKYKDRETGKAYTTWAETH
jgi:DNA polymerase I